MPDGGGKDIWHEHQGRVGCVVKILKQKDRVKRGMAMTQISDRYHEVLPRIQALCEGEDDAIALMATISAELYQHIDGFDWVGFYRVTEAELLKIGPYQGGHGCLTIPFDRGVCGAAARTLTPQCVDDVNEFEGHIACSSSTLSELVMPVFDSASRLIAVLDIDSDQPAFFSDADIAVLAPLLADLFGEIRKAAC